MQAKSWSKVITLFILLAILITMPVLSACGGGAPETTAPAPETTAPAPETAEFDVVKAAVAEYLASPAGNTKASDLQMSIADDAAPYIVSLRSADDYAAGHIPGAVNLKFGEISTLPIDEKVLVYCYTGQSASFATATLGMLDYDVSNLKHGMSSWSDNPDVYKKRYSGSAGLSTETTANAGSTNAMPVIENTDSNDDAEIVKAAALTVAPKYISSADLNMKIADGEEMTILSIRKADMYAVGHIPGAINAPYGTAIIDALDKLNPDAPVYVYCYTGHTAAQSAALLQMLGYDAYSVSFGMCGWSDDSEVTKGVCFTPEMSLGLATE
ncbi:rhodanese-like domain-containing protein [Chloroflexota bacterium]